MSDSLKTLAFFAFALIWFGGALVQFLRYWRKRDNYLRHFRSTAGYLLDAYAHAEIFTSEGRAIYRAVWEPQDDPELERLRREMWQGVGYLALWWFGIPILAFGVLVALTLLLWHPPK